MMEVEMQSPSFRPAYSSNSLKRARSPDDTYSPSRPSKRLTVTTEIDCSSFYLCGSPSTGSSRHTSEEWVQQAGNLTIDSPLLIGDRAVPFADQAMVADQTAHPLSGMNTPPTSLTRPLLAPLQTSFSRAHSSSRPASQALSLTSNDPMPQRSAPSIQIHPPTPDISLSNMNFSAATRPPTPLNGSPMSLAMISSPSRRNRGFAMGPRADCEKCRMGIKGHSVHLD